MGEGGIFFRQFKKLWDLEFHLKRWQKIWFQAIFQQPGYRNLILSYELEENKGFPIFSFGSHRMQSCIFVKNTGQTLLNKIFKTQFQNMQVAKEDSGIRGSGTILR